MSLLRQESPSSSTVRKVKIMVRILGATELTRTQLIGSQDPYCRIWVKECCGNPMTTKVNIDGDTRAVWNESFILYVKNYDEEFIFLEVKNKNNYRDDDLIGRAKIRCKDLPFEEKTLFYEIKDAKGNKAGFVHMSSVCTEQKNNFSLLDIRSLSGASLGGYNSDGSSSGTSSPVTHNRSISLPIGGEEGAAINPSLIHHTTMIPPQPLRRSTIDNAVPVPPVIPNHQPQSRCESLPIAAISHNYTTSTTVMQPPPPPLPKKPLAATPQSIIAQQIAHPTYSTQTSMQIQSESQPSPLPPPVPPSQPIFQSLPLQQLPSATQYSPAVLPQNIPYSVPIPIPIAIAIPIPNCTSTSSTSSHNTNPNINTNNNRNNTTTIITATEEENLPAWCEKKYTPEGRVYYVNHNTKQTSWNRPI